VADQLKFVIVTTDPRNGAELGAPFFQGTVEAAIKYGAGVKFKVCTPALDLWGEDLIPEIEETAGGAYPISRAMDDNVVTFTY